MDERLKVAREGRMRKSASAEQPNFDPMIVETGSNKIQDGRRRHSHIRPQVDSDEELDERRVDMRMPRTTPLYNIIR